MNVAVTGHVHVRTRTVWGRYPARLLPASVFRLMVALGLGRLFWTYEPHHPECTDTTGVLEAKA